MWLLEASIRQAIEQAQRSNAGPTADQLLQFEARFFGEDGSPRNRLLTIVDDKADIAVKGVMTKAPDFYSMLFGGGNVTYPEIIAALAEAEANDAVKSAVITMDSGGGHVDGLFNTIAAIEAFSKPIKTVVTGVSASAAYALAATTDSIEASNKAVRVGSIGIAMTAYVYEEEVNLASTAAPKKRPDLKTAEGQAIVREELDAMHEIFADAIAAGRDTSVQNVNANFGQGGTLLAEAALKRGMIDAIAGTPLEAVKTTKTPTASGGTQPENGTMDLQKLKAEHPAIFAAAKEEGVNEERERASAHLIMGEASGDMKTAMAAVKDGTGMTASINATYLAAGMNRSDSAARQGDDAAAAAAADGVDTDADASADDAVADAVAARLGITEE